MFQNFPIFQKQILKDILEGLHKSLIYFIQRNVGTELIPRFGISDQSCSLVHWLTVKSLFINVKEQGRVICSLSYFLTSERNFWSAMKRLKILTIQGSIDDTLSDMKVAKTV